MPAESEVAQPFEPLLASPLQAIRIRTMERVARKFASFKDEADADRAFYRSLPPAERLKIWLGICRFDLLNAPERRLQRVYRITPLGGR